MSLPIVIYLRSALSPGAKSFAWQQGKVWNLGRDIGT